jgi:two-component system chemotaxis response regulator CheB
MGNDGLNGARVMRLQNAPVLVQDMQSSVVWGMPGAIAKEGLATAILPAEQISDLLGDMATLS